MSLVVVEVTVSKFEAVVVSAPEVSVNFCVDRAALSVTPAALVIMSVPAAMVAGSSVPVVWGETPL